MSLGETFDHEQLVECLQALAYEPRLELLEILREPRTLPEIRLTPRRVLPGENPDRAISRQAIQDHLDRLMEIGVVIARESKGSGKRGREYTLHRQRLYQIMEEFRKVAVVEAGGSISRDETVDLGQVREGRAEEGARVVLVHGLSEGDAFPLRHAELSGGRGWIIGRKPGLHVSLEYDPYVSLENSEIQHEGRAYVLTDLRSSRNGTWLNWQRLGRDQRAPLAPGDVIGVGRSLLVFRER